MDAIKEVIWPYVSVGRILGVAAILLIVSCIYDFVDRPAYPKHLPRVGYGKGVVASAKTYFRTPSELKSWVDEGYKKVRSVLETNA